MNPVKSSDLYGEEFFDEFFEVFGVDLKEDLDIDLLNLHNEWMRQPNLYMKYGKLTADVKKKKGFLFLQENARIRKELLEQNGKVVEATVRSELESSKVLIDATYDESLTVAALKAIDIRKSALENEVKLYLGEYFSIPRENIVEAKGRSFSKKAQKKAAENVFTSKKRE